jgi:hypothetical protein
LGLSDSKDLEGQIARLTESLAAVNVSMEKTFEKMDALHLELAQRLVKTQIPFGNDKQ